MTRRSDRLASSLGLIDVPPLDEYPIWQSLPPIVGASFSVQTDLVGPNGTLSQVLLFNEGRAVDLEEWPVDVDCWLRYPYHRRLLWRTGLLDNVDLLEGADVAGAWPFLSCLDGLFELARPIVASSCVGLSRSDTRRLESDLRGDVRYLGGRPIHPD